MEVREALARAPIFSRIKRNEFTALARTAKVHRFAPGELLVREGEEAVAFYVLCRGEAYVVKEWSGTGSR